MRTNLFKWPVLAGLILLSLNAAAKDAVSPGAEELYKQGSYKEAADLLAPVANVDGGVDPATMLLYGKSLDKMTEQINTEAERVCYRSAGSPHSPKCMDNYAAKMNNKYGSGSFEYDPAIVTIKYTGTQFDKVLEITEKGDVAAEAAYYKLSKNLIGHPSQVLPRIEDFLKKYPKGEWHRKAMLLWARINEDVWWIHRNWAWLLYNWDLSSEDLILRAEPYRQRAIKAFRKVRGGEEGKAAKEELKLLKENKSDGKIYGIVKESSVEGIKAVPIQKQAE